MSSVPAEEALLCNCGTVELKCILWKAAGADVVDALFEVIFPVVLSGGVYQEEDVDE